MAGIIPPGPYTIVCPNVPGHSLTVLAAKTVQLVEDDVINPDVWEVEYVEGEEAIIKHVATGNVMDFRGGPLAPTVFNQYTDCIIWARHAPPTPDQNQRWLFMPEGGPMTVRIRSTTVSDNDSNYVTVQRCRPDRADPIAMNAEPGPAGAGPEPVVGERWSTWTFIPAV